MSYNFSTCIKITLLTTFIFLNNFALSSDNASQPITVQKNEQSMKSGTPTNGIPTNGIPTNGAPTSGASTESGVAHHTFFKSIFGIFKSSKPTAEETTHESSSTMNAPQNASQIESNTHANKIFEISNNHNASQTIVAKPRQPKLIIIGLALGGGAAKGFAHIGVIKALIENNIIPKVVTGTSAGSLVGSLYAYGYKTPQLEQIAYHMDEITLADFTFNRNGIIKGVKLQNFVNQYVHNVQLQNLKTKFIAVATDLDTGQGIGFDNGNTGVAVRASCSIPNIFLPVEINHHRYVDGGLSSPVPVSFARQHGANFVIAVDITSKPQNNKASGFLSNFDQTLNIMGVRLLNDQLRQANIVIKPDISKLSSFAFDQKKEAIKLGYNATIAQIPLIKAKIRQMTYAP